MKNTNLWTSEVFFRRLDYFLKTRNWTMYQLCINADITADALYKMRLRNGLPSLQSVCTICDALGVTLSEFFGTENVNPNCVRIMSSFDTMSEESLAILAKLVCCMK